MKTIFVMVKCDLGKAYAVADEAVLNLEQVSEVYSTSGQYDLLMKCYLAGDRRYRPVRDRAAADPPRRQGHFYDHRIQGILAKTHPFSLWRTR